MKLYWPEYFPLVVCSSAGPASFVRSSSSLANFPGDMVVHSRLPFLPLAQVMHRARGPSSTFPDCGASGRSLCQVLSDNSPILCRCLINPLEVWNALTLKRQGHSEKSGDSEEAVIWSASGTDPAQLSPHTAAAREDVHVDCVF